MTLIDCMNNHLSSFFSLLAASFTFSLLAAALSSDLAENEKKTVYVVSPFCRHALVLQDEKYY